MTNKDTQNKRNINVPGMEEESTGPSGTTYFLGIGINLYENFKQLNNAVRDINNVRDLLVEQYGFEMKHTKLLCDEEATRENIIQSLSDYKELPAEDRLIIYFSGHGHLMGEGETQKGFWISVDSKVDVEASYVDNAQIRDWIKIYKVRHLLLISDSCFSESLIVRNSKKGKNGTIKTWEKYKSRYIFSSGKEEVSDGEPGQNSPFTSGFLQILTDNTEILNITKLAEDVTNIVAFNYEQVAECSPLFHAGHKGGQFLFYPKNSDKTMINRPSNKKPPYITRITKKIRHLKPTLVAMWAVPILLIFGISIVFNGQNKTQKSNEASDLENLLVGNFWVDTIDGEKITFFKNKGLYEDLRQNSTYEIHAIDSGKFSLDIINYKGIHDSIIILSFNKEEFITDKYRTYLKNYEE